MNPNQLDGLVDRIDKIEDTLEKVNKLFAAFNIDKQQFVTTNRIQPGVGTKIAFDGDGLVKSSEDLSPQDIPALEIEKINGLKDAIDNKVDKNEIDNIQRSIDDVYHHTDTVKTGSKVNVDSHGFVNEVSDLLPEDIPQLSIDKIDGLQDELNQLKSIGGGAASVNDLYEIQPGTGCKVDYDKKGRITGSQPLSMNDIPNALIEKVNEVESSVSERARQSTVTELSKSINNKLDKNKPIKPGTYTKVSVDKNGLVTGNDELTKSDLPQLGINDITDLRDTLNDKAAVNLVEELNERIEEVRNEISSSKSNEDNQSRVGIERVHKLELKVSSLENTMNNILMKIPGDTILRQLESITWEVNSLSGRIAVIEKKLDIH